MKTSEVFKQAKEHLWEGYLDCFDGEAFMCHAIIEAAWVRDIHDKDSKQYLPYKRAQKIIHQRIHPAYDLEHWVRKNVKNSYKVLNKIHGAQQMQAYRHRWIDELIKEFEAKGQ